MSRRFIALSAVLGVAAACSSPQSRPSPGTTAETAVCDGVNWVSPDESQRTAECRACVFRVEVCSGPECGDLCQRCLGEAYCSFVDTNATVAREHLVVPALPADEFEAFQLTPIGAAPLDASSDGELVLLGTQGNATSLGGIAAVRTRAGHLVWRFRSHDSRCVNPGFAGPWAYQVCAGELDVRDRATGFKVAALPLDWDGYSVPPTIDVASDLRRYKVFDGTTYEVRKADGTIVASHPGRDATLVPIDRSYEHYLLVGRDLVRRFRDGEQLDEFAVKLGWADNAIANEETLLVALSGEIVEFDLTTGERVARHRSSAGARLYGSVERPLVFVGGTRNTRWKTSIEGDDWKEWAGSAPAPYGPGQLFDGTTFPTLPRLAPDGGVDISLHGINQSLGTVRVTTDGVEPVAELQGSPLWSAPIPGERAFLLASADGLVKRYNFDDMTSSRVELPWEFRFAGATASEAGIVFRSVERTGDSYVPWATGSRVLMIQGDDRRVIDLGHRVADAALLDEDTLVYYRYAEQMAYATLGWYSLSRDQMLRSIDVASATLSRDGTTALTVRLPEGEEPPGRPALVSSGVEPADFEVISLTDPGQRFELTSRGCVLSLDGSRVLCTRYTTPTNSHFPVNFAYMGVDVWDTASGKLAYQDPDARYRLEGAMISPDGMSVLGRTRPSLDAPSLVRVDHLFRNDTNAWSEFPRKDDHRWLLLLFDGSAVVHDGERMWLEKP